MTLVPRLRFPEFGDSKNWEGKTLGEIGDFYKGKGISKADIDINGVTKCIRYGELYTTYGEVINEVYSSTNLAHSEMFFSKRNDVIIPSSGETKIDIATASCVLSDNIALGSDLNIIRAQIDGIFLSYYLNSAKKYEIANIAQGVSVVHLYADKLMLIKVFIPQIAEQQKIADCLTSLDELIAAEVEKLETLKIHKKGLMQKLFPTEGKTLPEWRFPEFKDCGEWNETTLEKVVNYENGKAHESDISENGKYIVVNSKFISTEGHIRKYTNIANLLASKGDILMVLSDVPNGRAIAKCFYVDKNETYTINQRVCRLTPKNVDGLFLFYAVNRNDHLLSFDDGVKQTNIKKDDVLRCPINLPKQEKEQQKIADCLSCVDELIAIQSQKIEALKTHKKGLMQGLFPSAQEVEA